MSLIYDFFVWLLPKLRSGIPKQVADAKVFVFHHVVTIFMCSIGAVCQEKFTSICMAPGLMEGSGLFLGIYRLQQHLAIDKKSLWFKINGGCLWLSYTFCRVITPVYLLVIIYLDFLSAPDFCWYDRPSDEKIPFATIVVGYLFLTLLSFTWYIQITKKVCSGAASVFGCSSRVKKKEK